MTQSCELFQGGPALPCYTTHTTSQIVLHKNKFPHSLDILNVLYIHEGVISAAREAGRRGKRE